MALTGLGAALLLLLLLAGHPAWAALLAPLALGPGLRRVAGMVGRRLQMRRIAKADHPLDGLASARQTLLRMGIDEVTADRIVTAARAGEVRLATFDQESRVLSDIGPIPFFEGLQITPQQFRKRNRHVIELVVLRDVVCVKKSYRDRLSLEIELLALHAMAGLTAVPRIVAVDLRRRIVHQSFILGRNLGVLMSRHGVNDHVQDQVSVAYWGEDPWGPVGTGGVRAAAIAALSASVDPGVVARIGRLIEEIHQRRVTITDVKYGNVLLVDGEPHFCDFDRATVWSRNSWRAARVREHDREMFNYFFGGSLLIERDYRLAVDALSRERPDLLSPRIYYGYGYQSPGSGSLELGSGRWRCLRPALPDVAGKSILDLGSGNGLLPLEMLRAGARRVTGWERDPVLARYARLNHRWFEFTDNRWYPEFQLQGGSLDEAAAQDWSGYDMVTVLGGWSGEDPEGMARLLRTLSRTIECVVFQADLTGEGFTLATLRELLRANGYPGQRMVEAAGDERPLLIGRRASRAS